MQKVSKTHSKLVILALFMAVMFNVTACQEQDAVQPTVVINVTQVSASPTPVVEKSLDEQHVIEQGGKVVDNDQDQGSIVTISQEDRIALLHGRSLFTIFLNQTEGISVPLVDQWTLEEVTETENGRSFEFRSGDWSLILQEADSNAVEVLYHAHLNGLDNFSYLADILVNGTISPAQ